MTLRFERFCIPALCALLLAPDAFALQGLCVNSPENPTVVLGLLGVAAAGYPLARERLRSLFKRNNSSAKEGPQA